MKILNLIFIFLLSPALQADELPEVNYVLCQNGSIVRTVRIELDEQGCKTVYTKNGEDNVIGSGQFAISCTGFLNNVQKNLESAGWKCKNISGASISKDSK